MTVYWQFTDPNGTLSPYIWEVNPSDKTPGLLPQFAKNLIYSIQIPGQAPLLFEHRDQMPQTQATGTVVTQDQYLQLVKWVTLDRSVIVNDDLGNQWVVYFTQFQPTRRRNVSFPWLADYQLNWLVLQTTYTANPGRGK